MPRTSIIRAVLRVRKHVDPDWGTEGTFSVSRPRHDLGAQDFLQEEFSHDLEDLLPRAKRMAPGTSAAFLLKLKVWGDKYWTDCGWEYDAGADIISSRCVREGRMPRVYLGEFA